MKKVITYGSFDLFHEGHYNLLKRAKELGDYLIVGVTTDSYDEARGKLNIMNSVLERVESVRKTGLADKIIVEDHAGQKVEDIQKYGINVFTVGSDWKGKFDYLKEFCEVVYLDRTKDISSSLLRETQNPIIKLGIVGSGRIAHRFVPESYFVSGISVVANYNHHIESAKEFASSLDIDFYTDNYDDFLSKVTAVYVATPHETHYEYTKKALLAKKHVLCEKPMVLKKAEAEELYAIAKENNVILMEAIKTAYCPGFVRMMGVAKSGIIGEICDVEACFSRLTPPDRREMRDAEYGGAFTELGTYSLLPIIKLMGKDYKNVRFDSILADNGIDLYTKANFVFQKGLATCKNGLGVKSEGQLIIAGTNGYILAESPWWLTKTFEVRYEDSSRRERENITFLGNGLRYEICEFAKAINGSNDGLFKFTKGESIAMAGVMEEFLKLRNK